MADMTRQKKRPSQENRTDPADRRFLSDLNLSDIAQVQLDEFKHRPFLKWLRGFLYVVGSYLFLAGYETAAICARRLTHQPAAKPVFKAAQKVGSLTTRISAVTVSTSLVFILCIGFGVYSPIVSRSGEDNPEEVSLGSLLLPPGQEDRISEDDGYEIPDPSLYPEPPPSDFGDIPLPEAESYSFESSQDLLGGEPEESLEYIAENPGGLDDTSMGLHFPLILTPSAVVDNQLGEPGEMETTEAPDGDSTQPGVARHIVSPGENLWNICRKYNLKMNEVIAYNNISNPSELRPGFEILLPGATEESSLQFPLDMVSVNSGYGWRIHPILHRRMFHRGIDLQARKGTPVYAAAPGKVMYARRSRYKGNTILIDHGDGTKTVYMHLQSILVKRGARVGAGQVIARSGATGRVTGPHLHFEVWKDGRHINPLNALPPIPRSRPYARR